MAGGDLNIVQIATLLNTILGQARLSPAAVVDTSSFVSVAQTALKCAPDVLLESISQMFTNRDIISMRPYTRKFRTLERSNAEWGNAIRKLNYVDNPMEENPAWELTDGTSVDMYKVIKTQILQTNFYGQATWLQEWSVFDYQLNIAFANPYSFQSFMSGMYQNKADQREQAHEALARATILNLIGGVLAGNAEGGVVKVLTLYNAQNGTSLTAADVMKAVNFPDFLRFFVATIKIYLKLMSERSQKFQINVTGKPITRHTPREDVMMYLYTPFFEKAKTMVYGDIFHDSYMNIGNYEEVNYWQSIEDTQNINVTAAYTDATGAVQTETVANNNVLGIIFDREAAGYTTIINRGWTTPYNGKGAYTNNGVSFSDRYYNDFTEKAIVFTLE